MSGTAALAGGRRHSAGRARPARVSRPADRARVRTGRARRASSGGACAGCARDATRPCGSRGTAARRSPRSCARARSGAGPRARAAVRSSGGPAALRGVAASAAPSRGARYVSPAAARAHRLDELGVRGVLEHVAAGAGPQRVPGERRVLLHRQDHDRASPATRSRTCGIASSDVSVARHVEVEDEDRRLVAEDLRSAASASAASATTSKPSSPRGAVAGPERTTWWSSATTIVIVSSATDDSAGDDMARRLGRWRRRAFRGRHRHRSVATTDVRRVGAEGGAPSPVDERRAGKPADADRVTSVVRRSEGAAMRRWPAGRRRRQWPHDRSAALSRRDRRWWDRRARDAARAARARRRQSGADPRRAANGARAPRARARGPLRGRRCRAHVDRRRRCDRRRAGRPLRARTRSTRTRRRSVPATATVSTTTRSWSRSARGRSLRSAPR